MKSALSSLQEFTTKHNIGFLDGLRIRFSLRTLLLLTAVLAVVLGFISNIAIHARRQAAIGAQIMAAGGRYDYFASRETRYFPEPEIYLLLRKQFGDHACRQIKDVKLHGHQDVDAELALLKRLPKLKSLQLGGRKITNTSLELVAQSSSLEHLTFICHEGQVDSVGLASLGKMPLLNRLELYVLNDELLEGLVELSKLQALSVTTPRMTSAGMIHIARLSQLEELRLSDCATLQNQDLRHLAELTQLERIHLYKIPIDGKGLALLTQLNQLREIRLSHLPEFGDDDLAALQGFPQLQVLSLSGCPISDDGFGRLAQLSELKVLDLYGTAITDAAIPVMLQFPNLKQINVARTKVTLAGLQILASSPHLKNIQTSVPLTDEDRHRLRNGIADRMIYGSP